MQGRLDETKFPRRPAARRNRCRTEPRACARWATLAAGVLCLVLAHGLVSTGTPPLGVFALCVLAVASIAGAAMALFVWAGADTTRVFRSRSLAMVTAAMALVAGCATVRLALSSPFTQLLATGRFGKGDIADLGCLLVALVALGGLLVGVAESGSAYRRERRWPEQLAASR